MPYIVASGTKSPPGLAKIADAMPKSARCSVRDNLRFAIPACRIRQDERCTYPMLRAHNSQKRFVD